MKKFFFIILFVFVMAVPAMAKTDVQLPATLTQDDFKSFSTDLGMALSYQPLSPAAPLGDTLPGFDVGVEASYVKLDTIAPYFQKIDAVGNLPNALVIPRIHGQ